MYFGAFISSSGQKTLSCITGMKQSSMPFNYHGVPLFKGYLKWEHLRLIADKILSRLNLGKNGFCPIPVELV